ncbi:MAG: hypothetical protein CMM00_01600 [Rhodopirellula sp.]|nr:hypothetical protein [Rhodopirellula sp.]
MQRCAVDFWATRIAASLSCNMVFTLGLRHTAVVCSSLPLVVESSLTQASFALFGRCRKNLPLCDLPFPRF